MSLLLSKDLKLAKDYVQGDPLFSNVVLLLHGNGADGSTSIVDSSPFANTVTPVGNVQISTEHSKFGGSSIKFDGNGDRLVLPVRPIWDFNPTRQPVTIELWVRATTLPPSGNSCRLVMALPTATGSPYNSSSMGCIIGSDGRISVGWLSSSGYQIHLFSEQTISVNTWHHVAVVIDLFQPFVFIDGVGTQSVTGISTNTNTTGLANQLFIGFDTTAGSNFNFNGYISDLRITRTAARYSGNFVPPTEMLPDFQY